MSSIVVGLLASLITIGFTEVIKFLSSRHAERRAFRKLMFERRLQVAEQATSRLLSLIIALQEEIVFCGFQAGASSEVTGEYAQGHVNEISQQREVLAARESIYPFLLYFDVENRVVWPPELLQRYHRHRSNIEKLVGTRKELGKKANRAVRSDDLVSASLAEAEEAYRREYAAYAGVLREMLQRTSELLNLVKSTVRSEEVRLSVRG